MASPKPTPRYGGRTAEDRRGTRREQLLSAALTLVGEARWPALTVRGVCERAGLTSRYFYESFPDRGALAIALFDSVAGEATESVLTAVLSAPDTAPAKARAAIGAFVDLVADDPAKARVLFAEAPELPALFDRRVTTLKAFTRLVAAQGRDFYGIAAGEDALVATTATMLTGGLAQTLLAWLDGTLDTSRDALVEDAAALFVATGEAAVGLARSRARR